MKYPYIVLITYFKRLFISALCSWCVVHLSLQEMRVANIANNFNIQMILLKILKFLNFLKEFKN